MSMIIFGILFTVIVFALTFIFITLDVWVSNHYKWFENDVTGFGLVLVVAFFWGIMIYILLIWLIGG